MCVFSHFVCLNTKNQEVGSIKTSLEQRLPLTDRLCWGEGGGGDTPVLFHEVAPFINSQPDGVGDCRGAGPDTWESWESGSTPFLGGPGEESRGLRRPEKQVEWTVHKRERVDSNPTAPLQRVHPSTGKPAAPEVAGRPTVQPCCWCTHNCAAVTTEARGHPSGLRRLTFPSSPPPSPLPAKADDRRWWKAAMTLETRGPTLDMRNRSPAAPQRANTVAGAH